MMSNSTNFEIIAGTYEEYLLGYIFSSEENSLIHSFASHDHSSSVRCLTTCGNFLASGASDDRIIVYDLKARKEHCMLTHHQSTITSLAFTNNHSHIISASQDGLLAIARVGNWQLEKLWENAHKGGYVIDIAVHSSGKLALTLGTDCTLRTWNLVKGRVAYIINLNTKSKDPKSLEKIIFAPDDARFLLFGGKYTEIWSIELGGVLQVIEHDQKVTCCTWLDNETLFVGYEDGHVGTVNIENGKKKVKVGHNGRVKCVQKFESYTVTASSTGQIKVWSRKLKELASVHTGCRIICLCITQLIGKLKKEEPEENTNMQIVPQKKPVKRGVIVEIDESSDEERQDIVISKKRKKNKKSMSTDNQKVENDDDEEVVKKTKTKKKKKKNIEEESADVKMTTISDTNISNKGIKKKQNKDLNKNMKKSGKQKIKKKSRLEI